MESDEIERIRRETAGEKFRTNLRQSYFARQVISRSGDRSYLYGEEARESRAFDPGEVGEPVTIPAGGETREFAALRDHVHTITRRISEANAGKPALWYLSPSQVKG